jgi:hypothetical protein
VTQALHRLTPLIPFQVDILVSLYLINSALHADEQQITYFLRPEDFAGEKKWLSKPLSIMKSFLKSRSQRTITQTSTAVSLVLNVVDRPISLGLLEGDECVSKRVMETQKQR